MNPLLEIFNTPFETAPFDKIKNEHYLPALKEGIARAKKEIEKIKNNKEEATFENVVVALEEASLYVDRCAEIFFNLHSAESNDELQKVAKEFSPLLTEYGNDVLLDNALFARVKSVYDKKDKLNLNTEQKTLLDKSYKGFARNGALLDEGKKNKLREIDNALSKLTLEFGDHVLAETNSYLKLVTNVKDLEGMPETAIEQAQMTAKEKGKEGYALTLSMPSYIAVMTYAKNRALREELYRAYGSKAYKGDANDNQNVVKEIVRLRKERANLLGYKTHSEYVLEERMAGKPETVLAFLEDILVKAKPVAQEELNELKEFAKKEDGITEFKPWDGTYYSEKLKKAKFNVNDEMLKPYFKLENVINGVFEVAKLLYGLRFEERKDIPKYHQDVLTYDVLDAKGKHLSVFYADFFPRAGKRNGAWMTSYRSQRKSAGKDIRPHISIVCNFTKPTATKPSLLTFDEVNTLFHEFGHALHGMLSDCHYQSISGTNVYWDFVELPSQIMENWTHEKECLDLFAKHYETGEKIPAELIQRIKDSSNFHEGRFTLRQLSLGFLDMSWHTAEPEKINSVSDFERLAIEKTQLMPYDSSINTSCSFSHIFSGGYSSGYYSYKWAEVLDADAFDLFKEKGIFNPEVAKAFADNILSRGGSEHPLELFKKFRGREPKVDALLKRAGLLK